MNSRDLYRIFRGALASDLAVWGLRRRSESGPFGLPKAAAWIRRIEPAPPFPDPDYLAVVIEQTDAWSDFLGGRFRCFVEYGLLYDLGELLSSERLEQMQAQSQSIAARIAYTPYRDTSLRKLSDVREMRHSPLPFLNEEDAQDWADFLKVVIPEALHGLGLSPPAT